MSLKYKLIYNPHAGSKRHLISHKSSLSLNLLRDLCKRYELEVDFVPTEHPGHATELARVAAKEKYEVVIAAGGDGTVGEVANGLVGSETVLGILPFGTFMNVANMFSIPHDLHVAMLLIKLRKTRKVDLGYVSKLNGEKLNENYYFLESAGIGMDAEIQKCVWLWERKRYREAWASFVKIWHVPQRSVTIESAEKKMTLKAGLVTIANGPMSGAGLETSPEAKLNDHRLTVSVFTMTKLEFVHYLVTILRKKKYPQQNIETFYTTRVVISANDERPAHIDARWFGTLPAEFKIIPSALNVIIGYPEDKKEAALEEYTYLED